MQKRFSPTYIKTNMKILLTNDDGYQSTGLMLLAKSLVEEGHEVYVVAPDGQRSAFSHSANIYKDITFKRLDEYCGAKSAHISSGTPADCVKFAASATDAKFDLLVSGPNNGENYGDCILYSGTVAAAEEGALWGIPSVALSRVGFGGAFQSTVDYLTENVELLHELCPKNGLININVPDLPMSKIKGLKVVPQCESRLFDDYFEKKSDEVWFATGNRIDVEHKESDVGVVDDGYISVTPLTVLRTDCASIDALKKRLQK